MKSYVPQEAELKALLDDDTVLFGVVCSHAETNQFMDELSGSDNDVDDLLVALDEAQAQGGYVLIKIEKETIP